MLEQVMVAIDFGGFVRQYVEQPDTWRERGGEAPSGLRVEKEGITICFVRCRSWKTSEASSGKCEPFGGVLYTDQTSGPLSTFSQRQDRRDRSFCSTSKHAPFRLSSFRDQHQINLIKHFFFSTTIVSHQPSPPLHSAGRSCFGRRFIHSSRVITFPDLLTSRLRSIDSAVATRQND